MKRTTTSNNPRRINYRRAPGGCGFWPVLMLVIIFLIAMAGICTQLSPADAATIGGRRYGAQQYLPLVAGGNVYANPIPDVTPAPTPTPRPPNVESCPWQLQSWMVIENPANGEAWLYNHLDHTAWCTRLWMRQKTGESNAITITGSGWCDDYGCEPSCRDGYCVAGLSPWRDKIELWWDEDAEPVDRFEVYSARGRPTPAPTMEPGE